MVKCPVCGSEMISCIWKKKLPKFVIGEKGAIVEFEKRSKSEFCQQCEIFKINPGLFNVLYNKSTPLDEGISSCPQCGEKMLEGNWSDFLPLLEDKTRDKFVLISDVSIKGRDYTETCLGCGLFMIHGKEFELIDGKDEHEVKLKVQEKIRAGTLYGRSMGFGAACLGLSLAGFALYFGMNTIKEEGGVLAVIIVTFLGFLIGALFGALFGAIIGSIVNKIKKRSPY